MNYLLDVLFQVLTGALVNLLTALLELLLGIGAR